MLEYCRTAKLRSPYTLGLRSFFMFFTRTSIAERCYFPHLIAIYLIFITIFKMSTCPRLKTNNEPFF
ncbi:MAG: hypothetical protein ACI8R1_000802 [Psychrobacter glaciei]|jgi:hypothetical protein